MKKITAVLLVSLMAASGASMAKEGGSGGSGGSMRMEPFNGDINKATPREQESIYYKIAVMRDKQEKEKLAKQDAAEQPVQK